MSIIGPDYGKHQRNVDELEQDYQIAQKRAKAREEQREKKIIANTRDAMADVEKKSNATINDVRENYQDAFQRSKQVDAKERQNLEARTYDRLGKLANQVEDIAIQRDNAMRTYDAAEDHYKATSSAANEYFEKRAAEATNKHQSEIEQLTERYQKDMQELRDEYYDKAKTKGVEQVERTKKEAAEAILRAQSDVQQERKSHMGTVNRYETTLKQQNEKADTELERRVLRKEREMLNERRTDLENERASRGRETDDLRMQLKDATETKRQAISGWNAGREKAIRDYEHDFHTQMSSVQTSNAVEKEKMKRESARVERFYDQGYKNLLREKNEEIASKLAKANGDARGRELDLQKQFEIMDKQMKNMRVNDDSRSERRFEEQQELVHNQYDKAYANQSERYKEELAERKAQADAQIQQLKAENSELKSTDDVGKISAAAEEALRKQMTEKYEKSLQEDVARNRRATDEIYGDYRDLVKQSTKDQRDQAVDLTRKFMREENDLKNNLGSHIEELDKQRKDAIFEQQNRLADTREKLEKQHIKQTRNLSQGYEDMQKTRDEENHYRIRTAVEQNEFEKKQLRRELNARVQDTIRSYEKKLADQKMELTDRIEAVTKELQDTRATHNREMQKALDDQARSYDHRLAEAEAHFKNREKQMAQMNEENLEKLKNTNARLLSKKG